MGMSGFIYLYTFVRRCLLRVIITPCRRRWEHGGKIIWRKPWSIIIIIRKETEFSFLNNSRCGVYGTTRRETDSFPFPKIERSTCTNVLYNENSIRVEWSVGSNLDSALADCIITRLGEIRGVNILGEDIDCRRWNYWKMMITVLYLFYNGNLFISDFIYFIDCLKSKVLNLI